MPQILKPANKEKTFEGILQNIDSNNEFVVWFEAINHRNPREIDCLIYHPSIGLQGLELKGYLISDIVEIQGDSFKTKSRTEKPWIQANDSSKSIARLITDSIKRNIFIPPAVVFWQITRSEFKNAISHSVNNYTKDRFVDLTEATIFKDDIVSIENFKKRLRIIANKPYLAPSLRNTGKNQSYLQLTKEDIRIITDSISPNWVAKISSPYDAERIEKIEKRIERIVRKEVDPDGLYWCYGKVGTGKTFMGLAHAINAFRKKKKVLFVCFNKTLSTDIRRLLWVGGIYENKHDEDLLKVKDFYQLVVESEHYENPDHVYRRAEDIKEDYEILNERGKIFLDILTKRIPSINYTATEEYDLVVVDESQDLEEWMIDLVYLYTNAYKNLFMIYGENQILYRDSSSKRLDEIKGKAKEYQLRRVFRNTGTNFWIAQMFLEGADGKAFNIEKARRFYIKHYAKSNTPENAQVEIERDGGEPPFLHPLSNGYNEKEVIDRLMGILKIVVEKTLKLKGNLCDILILVPTYKSFDVTVFNFNWYTCAKKAIEKLGLQYRDYVNPEGRRELYGRDEIRICTYHSSRGLEAYNTILIGFHNIRRLTVTNEHNEYLAYITLSRAKFDTHIVYFQGYHEPEVITYLKAIFKIVCGDNQTKLVTNN